MSQIMSRLRTLDLGEIDRLNGESIDIEVISGVIWLTSAGRSEDVLIAPGEHFRADGLALIVIQALAGAVYRCSANAATISK